MLNDSFDDATGTPRYWVADAPATAHAKVQIDRQDGNNVLALTVATRRDANEVSVRRALDLTAVRGHRIRLSGRVHVPNAGTATAGARLSISPLAGEHTYEDITDTSAVTGDNVRVVSLGPSPSPQITRLSDRVNGRLVTLTRTLALARFLLQRSCLFARTTSAARYGVAAGARYCGPRYRQRLAGSAPTARLVER